MVSAKAQLDSAKFNLSQCTVSAPADGFVTDWQIRDGSMANPISAAAAGTFIDTSETFIVASFAAEELIHVRPGQDVELAFRVGRASYSKEKWKTSLRPPVKVSLCPAVNCPRRHRSALRDSWR